MSDSGLGRRLTEYGDREFALFLRRSFAHSLGFGADALSKPIVGIVNTYSEFNPCHRGFRDLAEAAKRGVWQAGGLPLEFPVLSLGEIFLSPTSMLYRNLMAMDVETMLRAQPLDAAVLLGGCDKTVPALLMGAASANVPSIVVVAGPMLTGSVDGDRVGACTDCRRFWARYRRGEIGRETLDRAESQLAPTTGTCGVMGTASTMACVTEALGMMLPGGASIPAVHADRLRQAEASGRRAVGLAAEERTPDRILTRDAFENALRTLQAIGGSTNAIIHLAAVAGRVGLRLGLEALNDAGATTPLLVDLKPTGDGYMEDFHRAGGLPVVLRELKSRLHLDCVGVSGRPLGDLLDVPFPLHQTVIRPADRPIADRDALVAVKGTLAPDGAVIKRASASPGLLNVTGRAVVFRSLEDLARRVDDPQLDVRADDILVLANAGPLGGPGMPEAGALPIPKKLAGVKDMVRISDARMSGTAFGTVVLHVSPEGAAGGPIGLVRTGDRISLSVDRRRLDLDVDERELERRRSEGSSLVKPERGYERLYLDHVQQAHLGCDFDFLRPPALR
ncbi:MAG TPA: dihydroxy-acid dehydratase [Planctomycetota bacterium]|nr:dihydroxy-acid dehydratase [Planctomycetota bacterium]